jgi:hypothetical protein
MHSNVRDVHKEHHKLRAFHTFMRNVRRSPTSTYTLYSNATKDAPHCVTAVTPSHVASTWASTVENQGAVGVRAVITKVNGCTIACVHPGSTFRRWVVAIYAYFSWLFLLCVRHVPCCCRHDGDYSIGHENEWLHNCLHAPEFEPHHEHSIYVSMFLLFVPIVCHTGLHALGFTATYGHKHTHTDTRMLDMHVHIRSCTHAHTHPTRAHPRTCKHA